MRCLGAASFPRYQGRLSVALVAITTSSDRQELEERPPRAGGWLTSWLPEARSAWAVCRTRFCSSPCFKSTLKADSSHQNIKNSINARLWLPGSQRFFLSRLDSLPSPEETLGSTQRGQRVPETDAAPSPPSQQRLGRCNWVRWSVQKPWLGDNLVHKVIVCEH